MKILLTLLLTLIAIPSALSGVPDNGRYQLVVAQVDFFSEIEQAKPVITNTVLKIDTATGKTWFLTPYLKGKHYLMALSWDEIETIKPLNAAELSKIFNSYFPSPSPSPSPKKAP